MRSGGARRWRGVGGVGKLRGPYGACLLEFQLGLDTNE